MASLNLVVIRSKDFAAAQVFYESIGITFEKHSHGSGPEHLVSESDSFVFEIYPSTDHLFPTSATRIGFQVDDVDGVVSRLESLGVRIKSLPKDTQWGRRAVVEDFDNHTVELTCPL